LLECELPPQLTEIEVQNGAVRMRGKDEFEVRLTLGYEGDLSKWRVLWLSLGAIGSESADRGGKVGGSGLRGLTEAQRAALGQEVERRMGLAPDPLREMYRVLHELSANLVLDSVFRQAHALKQGTWKGVILLHFGKGETGSLFTSLKIEYWERQAPRSANRLQSGSVSVDPFRPSPSSRLTPQPDQVLSAGGLPGRENWALKGPPSLKIELDEDRHVSCSHWPVVVDPETEESALFSVGDCGADLERLLEKAVTCSVHSRLLELEEAIGAEALLSCGRSTGEWDEAFGSEAGGSTEGRKEGGVEKLWVRVYDNVGVGVEVNRR
jgi:mediator of RNA polymerase II transcription subunit 14